MSFFKNVFGKIKTKLDKKESPNETVNEIPHLKDLDEFFVYFRELKDNLPQNQLKEQLEKVLEGISPSIKKQIHKTIRRKLYGIFVEEFENKKFTANFVNFRISIYNPLYKETKNSKLAKLILILISRSPSSVNNKKILDEDTDILSKNPVEFDQLLKDLEIFKLTEKEKQDTIQKIIEYNKKNVKFTQEEEIIIANSELLRSLIEATTFVMQNFVEKCSNWKKYFLKTSLFEDPALISVLKADKKIIFGERFGEQNLIDLILTENIKNDLEPLVPPEYSALFKKDVSAVINRLKNLLIKEEKEFVKELKTTLAGNIVLLKHNRELPSFEVLNSILSKSFKFYEHYYPDLMKAVLLVKNDIFATLGQNYTAFEKFKEKFQAELTDFLEKYSKDNFKITTDYTRFLEYVSNVNNKKEMDITGVNVEYLPEELNFINSHPDVEPAIMELNEKIRTAQQGLPVFEGEYFFSDKREYLKTALLSVLDNILHSKSDAKIVKSVLLKSIDKNQGESSEIIYELLSSMKEEAMKKKVVSQLLKKQKAKHHVTEVIKNLLKQYDDFFMNNSENLTVELQKFSSIAGVGFFIAYVNGEAYKITANYKGGKWEITYVAKVKEFDI